MVTMSKRAKLRPLHRRRERLLRWLLHPLAHLLDVVSPSRSSIMGYPCCPYCDRRVEVRSE